MSLSPITTSKEPTTSSREAMASTQQPQLPSVSQGADSGELGLKANQLSGRDYFHTLFQILSLSAPLAALPRSSSVSVFPGYPQR